MHPTLNCNSISNSKPSSSKLSSNITSDSCNLHDTPNLKSSLLILPTELQLSIVSFLPYPDRLAIKHSNRYFYDIVTTSVQHRLNWLIARANEGLALPRKTCRWKTDADFCGSAEIREFMERRRRHLDCPSKFGVRRCLVIEGGTCPGPRAVGAVGRWHGGLGIGVVLRRNEYDYIRAILQKDEWRRRNPILMAAAIVLVLAVLLVVVVGSRLPTPR